jgi:methionine sulfoxide reductase heme-binding subunit
MIALAAAGPSALWYLTRGTGTIAMILLTISVALGVANVRHVRTQALPRFVLDAVHRNVSLLAVTFVVVHVITSVLDSFAPISLLDAVIPFRSAYRPLWLGLGAVAFDLLLAVTITSLLRRRFGYRSWRATHWLAYASWPVALLHGLGTGSDTKTGWMLIITAACVVVVIVAVVARATAGWPNHLGRRTAALVASAAIPLGLLVWLPSGPLAAGWAQRAGTPSSLLASSTSARPQSFVPKTSGAGQGRGSASTTWSAQVSGTVRQGQTPDELAEVDINLSVSGRSLSALDLKLIGQPLDGGGVEMERSSVTLGTSSDPTQYRGQITSLNSTNIAARVRNSSGATLSLALQLQIDPNAGTASGSVSATP